MSFLRTEILILLTLSSMGGMTAQNDMESAMVSGHVYDSESNPLPGARVIPFPLEVGTSAPIPFADTNSEGAYSLNLPAYGKTRICASKKGAGYPDTKGAVFVSGNENEPEVDVTAGSRLHDVDIHLPPPDGSVDLTVTDKDTGLTISRARITLRREEDPSIMYSGDIEKTATFTSIFRIVPSRLQSRQEATNRGNIRTQSLEIRSSRSCLTNTRRLLPA